MRALNWAFLFLRLSILITFSTNSWSQGLNQSGYGLQYPSISKIQTSDLVTSCYPSTLEVSPATLTCYPNGTAVIATGVGVGLTVGTTTITGGANTNIEYNNNRVLGEYGISGTGSVAMTGSPTIATPTITTSAVIPIIAPPSDSTTAIQLENAAMNSTVLDVDTTNGRVGIGTTSPATLLQLAPTITTSDIGTYASQQTVINSAPTNTASSTFVPTLLVTTQPAAAANSSSTFFGILDDFNVPSSSSQTYSVLYGMEGYIQYNGTGNVSQLYGNKVLALNNSASATASILDGLAFTAGNTSTGKITNAYGILAAVENTNAGGTVTSAHGIGISVTNSGTMTNAVGLTTTVSGATNNTLLLLGTTTIPSGNFGIYNSSTYNNYFAGNLGIGTISPNALQENLATTEQLRLSYDATHYTSFTVGSGGGLTIGGTLGTLSVGATTHTGDVTLSTHNIITDTSTGTDFATGTTQKIGFYGATPIVQPTGDACTALQNLGLVSTCSYTVSGYLAATGATTGATSQAQVFTDGITVSAASPVNFGGTAAYEGQISYNSGGITNFYIDNTYDNASALMKLRMRTAGTPVVAISILGSGAIQFPTYGAGAATFDASGNITSVSDERLKNIIGPVTEGLPEILQINPILYQYNAASGLDTVNTYAGFSAQNVMQYIPEAVGQSSDGYYSYNDRPVIAALVNAVKTLQAEIVELQTSTKTKTAIVVPTATAITDGSKIVKPSKQNKDGTYSTVTPAVVTTGSVTDT